MPNTYTQVHIHYVFAVKHRKALIAPEWKERMHQYITGIVRANKHKMLQINSMPDHLHMFIGFGTHQSMASLIQQIKTESAKWIKEQDLCKSFAWQEGFGAFSYARSQVPNVICYIQNQEAHHQKEKFLDEYTRFLNAFEIDWDHRYIFKEPE